MSYSSKNPKVSSTVLADITNTTPSNPGTSSHKLINRNGLIFSRDSAGVEVLVSGRGTGEINYAPHSGLENGATTAWATYKDAAATTPVDGTGGSPTTLTLSANATTPLRGSYDLKVVKSAANSQGEGFSIQLDTVKAPDFAKKLKIQFDLDTTDANYTAGDLVCYVYDITNSTLITPSSPSIPKMKGTFQLTFDTSATGTSYRVIFHYAVTAAAAITNLFFDSFVVGPGVVVQSPAVSPMLTDLTFTPTGYGTTTALKFSYQRTANVMRGKLTWTNGTPTATPGRVAMPAGITIDSTLLSTTANTQRLGAGTTETSGTTSLGADVAALAVFFDGSTTNEIFIATNVTANAFAKNNANNYTVLGERLSIDFEVPIAEWAGNGTVILGPGPDVEYAYNTSTTDAADTTSFGYGPSGNTVTGTLTALRKKRVRFQYPIQVTDEISLEYRYPTGTGVWRQLVSVHPSTGVSNLTRQISLQYGIGIDETFINSTDVDVIFGQYVLPSGATYGAAGDNWSTTLGSWRLVKRKAGAATGIAVVANGQSGLMPGLQSAMDDTTATRLGYKTYSHGTNYNGGNAPTITLTSGGGTLSSVSYSFFTPYQKQDGVWFLRFNLLVQLSSAARTSTAIAINGVSYSNPQAITAYNDATANATFYAVAGGSDITAIWSSVTTTGFYASGDVKLSAKPSWAY